MNSNNPLAVEPETEKDAVRENLPADFSKSYCGQCGNDKDYLK
jgi:hypothetical protein